MDFIDAIRLTLPLQARIPSPRRLGELDYACVSEVFLADTAHGAAVIWLEPFWQGREEARAARISYSTPIERDPEMSWVDDNPRYGPFCIVYQKPFIMERLTNRSPVWGTHLDWQGWLSAQDGGYSREQAWQRVARDLAVIQPKRIL